MTIAEANLPEDDHSGYTGYADPGDAVSSVTTGDMQSGSGATVVSDVTIVDGDHRHTISAYGASSPTALDIRPRCYALAYIYKL